MALYSTYDTSSQWWSRVAMTLGKTQGEVAFSPQATYQMLEAYYLNNALYDQARMALLENAIWTEGMLGLRNPANRVVEFYAAKIWPGSLPGAIPMVGASEAVLKAIQQVWEWSNWGAQKQVAARHFAMFGDWFAKMETNQNETGDADKVYIWPVRPEYVTDLKENKRGLLTFIRVDIPQVDKRGKFFIEAWDKQTQIYRSWWNNSGPASTIEQLGKPYTEQPFDEFGVDFIPFVHAKFRDVGDVRGQGCFTHALDKIDEANRQATRLHQILFRYNRPLTAISANGVDGQNRPLPPPKVGETDENGYNRFNIGDDTLISLPGMAKLDQLVPQLNYSDALSILNSQMGELSEDLPELLYYHLKELGANISGRAVRTILEPAEARVLEARGNIESALVRAHEMALTIGIKSGIFKEGLGSYENGDFKHQIAERDVFQLSDLDDAEVVDKEVGYGLPMRTSLRRQGWSDEDFEQMDKDRKLEDTQKQASLAQTMLNARREFDKGGLTGE